MSSTISSIYDVSVMPLYTEKATAQANANTQYTFVVHRKATKILVKKAIEKIFTKKVLEVNIINIHPKIKIFKGREGKRPGYKKAIVRLGANESLEFFA